MYLKEMWFFMKTVVLIPALNPDEKLVNVIRECKRMGLQRFVVIDDGSTPDFLTIFDEAKSLGARVFRHDVNRGKGAALKTGITYAATVFPDLDGVVTADADGQHEASDIFKVAQAVGAEENRLVLGIRDFAEASVPLRSRFGNRASEVLFFLMTGVRCSDTQTGLRGIPKSMFTLAEQTPGERYDFEMNFLTETARRKTPIYMLPIQTIYLDDNHSSHFRVIRDSLLIYQRPLKYLVTALGSFVLDIFLFVILSSGIFPNSPAGIWWANTFARCGSGFFNFKLNQVWSFQVKERRTVQFWKYLLLFISVMQVSSVFVSLCSRLPLPLPLIKAMVDTVLFFVNYYVQRHWIFVE